MVQQPQQRRHAPRQIFIFRHSQHNTSMDCNTVGILDFFATESRKTMQYRMGKPAYSCLALSTRAAKASGLWAMSSTTAISAVKEDPSFRVTLSSFEMISNLHGGRFCNGLSRKLERSAFIGAGTAGKSPESGQPRSSSFMAAWEMSRFRSSMSWINFELRPLKRLLPLLLPLPLAYLCSCGSRRSSRVKKGDPTLNASPYNKKKQLVSL